VCVMVIIEYFLFFTIFLSSFSISTYALLLVSIHGYIGKLVEGLEHHLQFLNRLVLLK